MAHRKDERKIICECEEKVTLTLQDYAPGQEGDKFSAFCPKCKKRWQLEDTTSEYEEMVMNEITDPQNGEYLDKEDDVWRYKDGTSME